ncbi:Mitochondrial ribosomal protein L46 [Operophtera brumata]|uniref:Mitochondrial ribosomal protein L46 n=1 Tax=Operophtera brumata TaxID=104452 RepID=A0A0L7LG63_OPEBR|nr:Mitochondrial ribosomal protein L46 [Operophtera brumata]
MLCRTLLNTELSLCYRIYTRGLSSSSAWDVLTGVCVERLPVVTPPLNEMQQKYKNLLSTIEIEKSLKSDHDNPTWLTRSEMQEFLPDRYNKSVREFLLDESF